MLKKIVFLLLLVLLVLSPSIYAKVTLREAVGKALEMSRDVRDQRLNADASVQRMNSSSEGRGMSETRVCTRPGIMSGMKRS